MSDQCCSGRTCTCSSSAPLTLGPTLNLASPPNRPAPGLADDCCAPPPPPQDPLAKVTTVSLWRDRSMLLPAISGVLVAFGLAVGAWWSDAAAVVLEAGALLAGGWTFVPEALLRLRRGRLGVGLLMTIAAIGAVALGRIGEAAALAFLFSIAEALEHRAMTRAQGGLRALLDLIPARARVLRDGVEEVVAVADLRQGDVLLIGAGERVSTDGTLTEGRSWVDTSAITGESFPVDVGPGDEVLAGSVNGTGSITVTATADGRDNSLTTIVRLVEEAHSRKGERARLADRIARPLVPAILVISSAVALVGLLAGDPGLWIERALVVLVAASPCALAIAVPVTVISAIGSASRLGVVIKSGEAFEQLGTVRAVAFDKTGTLTRNEPQVVEVVTAPGHDRESVLALAASLEATSTHPLATAVVLAGTVRTRATEVEEQPGRGLSGQVGHQRVRVGSPRWIDGGPLGTAVDDLAGRGMSVVVVEAEGAVVGAIGVRDELKPEAAEAVQALRDRGIAVTMLTGDNRRTAAALAAEAGIDDVRSEMLPADKATAIEASNRSIPTAMVGDGINDAPALAAATVGIAMGVTGSAAAVESADVAFTGHDLRLLPRALEHAHRGRRIMTGNIVLALAIIVVLVPLALFGVLGLAQVVLVHELAEVLVILNAARAARVRDEDPVGRTDSKSEPALYYVA